MGGYIKDKKLRAHRGDNRQRSENSVQSKGERNGKRIWDRGIQHLEAERVELYKEEPSIRCITVLTTN